MTTWVLILCVAHVNGACVAVPMISLEACTKALNSSNAAPQSVCLNRATGEMRTR